MGEKDLAEKTLESCNDVFADIINVLFFGGKRKIKEQELEQAVMGSVYKADRKLRGQERDTAKYWRSHSIRISLLGIENETDADGDMPLRIFGYDGASYRDQLYSVRDAKGNYRRNRNPRFPVATAVLYFGMERWNSPKTIFECVGSCLDEDMKPFVTDLKINLFEIAFLTDEQVAMFESDFRIVADYFVQMRRNRDYKPSDIQFRHVREVLQLMSVLTRDSRFEDAANAAMEGGEAANMCEVLDRAEKRGELKGKREGRLEGRLEKSKETAARLKARGFSNSDISDIVDIDIKTIDSWFPVDGGLTV